MKRVLYWLSIPLIVYVFLEACLGLFFHFNSDRFTFFDPGFYLRPDSLIQLAAPAFDAELGWDMQYETEYGERPSSNNSGNIRVITYGDSYTHCDEVGDSSTWQTFMEDRLTCRVLNFGVSAYGTDQAVMKFEDDTQTAEVAVLGLIGENINRVVNRYRPYYSLNTKIPLTKPRFQQIGSLLYRMENPIGNAEDLSRLGDPDFLASICTGDYWCENQLLPTRRFPYSKILFYPSFQRELKEGKMGDVDPRPDFYLWLEDEEVIGLYREILKRFDRIAKERGAKPLIVLFPTWRHVQMAKRGGDVGFRRQLKRIADEEGFDYIDGIGIFEDELSDRNPDFWALFSGAHLSHIGNGVMGHAISDSLRQWKWLE